MCSTQPFTGFYVRGLVYSVLRKFDAGLATKIHDSDEIKPFAISPLRPWGFKKKVVNDMWLIESDKEFVFDVKFVWDDLVEGFMSGLMELPEINIDDCLFEVKKIEFQRKGYEELSQMVYEGRIGLEFLTPTFFNIKGRSFPYLFPDLRRLVGNLLNIWNRYSPSNLKIDPDEAMEAVEDSAYIRSYELKTREIKFEDMKLAGFKGKIEIVYSRKNKVGARYLTPLLNFSQFSNVGEKRTYGFGVVSLTYLNKRNQNNFDASVLP